MNLLVIVPARGGSKRLPGKNLKRLGGRSLLERTENVLVEAGIDCPRLLTTDSEDIAAAGRKLGWLVPFLRPAELATDSTPTVPAVLHALDWFLAEHGSDPSLVMVLQVTSPFRRGETLSRGLELISGDTEADAVVAVRDLHCAPFNVFTVNDGRIQDSPCNSDERTVFAPSGVMYLIRTSALRRYDSLLPPHTLAITTDQISSIDIDTQQDWNMAEAIIQSALAP